MLTDEAPISAANLKSVVERLASSAGVVLFSDPTGSSASVTLAQEIGEFDFLEIDLGKGTVGDETYASAVVQANVLKGGSPVKVVNGAGTLVFRSSGNNLYKSSDSTQWGIIRVVGYK